MAASWPAAPGDWAEADGASTTPAINSIAMMWNSLRIPPSVARSGYAGRFLEAGSCHGRLGRSASGKSRFRTRSYLYSELTVPSDSL